MQPDRQVVRLRGGEDRPVAPAPERLRRLRPQLDLREPPVAGALLDLLHRGLGVVLRHQDRCAQPRLQIDEVMRLPVVHRRAQRRRLIEVARGVAAEQRLQHAIGDVVGVQQLLAHERNVGARQSAARRPGIAPRRVGREARIGAAIGVDAAVELAVFRHVLAPALGQVLVQRAGLHVGMDVAIDDAETRIGLGTPLHHIDGRVHCTVSFRRG